MVIFQSSHTHGCVGRGPAGEPYAVTAQGSPPSRPATPLHHRDQNSAPCASGLGPLRCCYYPLIFPSPACPATPTLYYPLPPAPYEPNQQPLTALSSAGPAPSFCSFSSGPQRRLE